MDSPLAVNLFELGRLTLGIAAELCNMNKIQFMDELDSMEIIMINLDDDQILDELQNACNHRISDSGPLIVTASSKTGSIPASCLLILFSKELEINREKITSLPKHGLKEKIAG
jgi:hypothetical protein